jgi:tRNA(Ile)-lysidine synthase
MNGEPTIVRAVRTFLARHRPPSGPIVAAVSGGPDSIALLRALLAAGIEQIVVAHLNHGLRGLESDGDEAFVANLASEFGLRFQGTRRRVAADAIGDNLEATARRVRYEWLAGVAREIGAAWVATGHTADDQAETVLFQLLRGSGLDGLAGIAASRPLADGVQLVRPILAVKRAGVIGYLGEIVQDYRTDATNADTTRSRSRIRHELLPLLARQYNPRVVETLTRLAAQASGWQRDLDATIDGLLRAAELPRAGRLLVFDRRALSAAARRRRRLLWRSVWLREGWPRQQMGFREWDRLAGLCRGGPTAIDLPGGIRARRAGNVIQVGPIGGT